jgi:hypothetical protein
MQEIAGRRAGHGADLLAAQIRQPRDPRRFARDDTVHPLRHGHDDPQIGVIDRVTQRLRLGIRRHIGLAFGLVAGNAGHADQIGEAAHGDLGLARIDPVGREQDRRDLERGDVAEHGDRREPGRFRRARRNGRQGRRAQQKQVPDDAPDRRCRQIALPRAAERHFVMIRLGPGRIARKCYI